MKSEPGLTPGCHTLPKLAALLLGAAALPLCSAQAQSSANQAPATPAASASSSAPATSAAPTPSAKPPRSGKPQPQPEVARKTAPEAKPKPTAKPQTNEAKAKSPTPIQQTRPTPQATLSAPSSPTPAQSLSPPIAAAPFLTAAPDPAPWPGTWSILALLSGLTCAFGLSRWRTQIEGLVATLKNRALPTSPQESAPTLELPPLGRAKPNPAPAPDPAPAEPLLIWTGRPRHAAPAAAAAEYAPALSATLAPAKPAPSFAAAMPATANTLPDWLVRSATPAAAPAIPAPPPSEQNNASGIILRLDPVRFATGSSLVSLRYRLIVTNTGPHPLGPVSICGDMIAASPTKPTAIDGPFPPTDTIALPDLHEVPVLFSKETHEITGELHLPLTEIPPLRIGSARFFVPLVRLRAETRPARRPAPAALAPAHPTKPIAPIIHCASFLLGEPLGTSPGGLGPFRLDGPARAFYQIAQQTLTPQP